MKAYLPKTRPLSGDYPEKWFGESTGDGVAVLFEDSQYDDWLGIFQKGEYGCSFAGLLGEKPFAFVIANGQGYVVDIDAKEIVCMTDDDYLQAAITVPNKELAVAAGFTNLHIYGLDGLVWEERSFAMDGIRLQRVEGSKVFGEFWSIDWKPFVLDVETWQIEVGGSSKD